VESLGHDPRGIAKAGNGTACVCDLCSKSSRKVPGLRGTRARMIAAIRVDARFEFPTG